MQQDASAAKMNRRADEDMGDEDGLNAGGGGEGWQSPRRLVARLTNNNLRRWFKQNTARIHYARKDYPKLPATTTGLRPRLLITVLTNCRALVNDCLHHRDPPTDYDTRM